MNNIDGEEIPSKEYCTCLCERLLEMKKECLDIITEMDKIGHADDDLL